MSAALTIRLASEQANTARGLARAAFSAFNVDPRTARVDIVALLRVLEAHATMLEDAASEYTPVDPVTLRRASSAHFAAVRVELAKGKP